MLLLLLLLLVLLLLMLMLLLHAMRQEKGQEYGSCAMLGQMGSGST
jgi:preprotein translocase subunit YajC